MLKIAFLCWLPACCIPQNKLKLLWNWVYHW